MSLQYCLQNCRPHHKTVFRALFSLISYAVSQRAMEESFTSGWKLCVREHIRKCCSTRRPKLTPLYAAKRFEFPCFWKGVRASICMLTLETEAIVRLSPFLQSLFSDEFSAHSVSKLQSWVFRHGYGAYRCDLVNPTTQKGKIKIMVWAAISLEIKTSLIFMTR